jgi:hypothetical protein
MPRPARDGQSVEGFQADEDESEPDDPMDRGVDGYSLPGPGDCGVHAAPRRFSGRTITVRLPVRLWTVKT